MKKKSNWQLSERIRKNKDNISKLNKQIKDKSIKKNKLIKSIDDDVDELTSRFKKKSRK